MAAESRAPGDAELGQHLGAQPLEPVARELASPVEKQLASALGITDRLVIPRLPACVELCHSRSGTCLWQWVVRAALEEVNGAQLSHLDSPTMIAALRDELKLLRRQTKSDFEELGKLRELLAIKDAEIREGRVVKRQLVQADADNKELREANESLVKLLEGVREEARRVTAEREQLAAELEDVYQYNDDVESVLEDVEGRLDMVHLFREQEKDGHLEAQKLLHLERAENLRIRQDALEIALLSSKRRKKRTPKAQSQPSPTPRTRYMGASFTLPVRRK